MSRQIQDSRAGFTLIEIMAVVVIIGLLSGIVGVAVFAQVDKGRATAAKTQIRNLEGVLELYHMDNSRFPSTEQGLEALVNRPGGSPEPRNYPDGGYMRSETLPVDPWGEPYLYENPGQHNRRSFDVWTLGADGVPGGNGVDRDLGNWIEDDVGS